MTLWLVVGFAWVDRRHLYWYNFEHQEKTQGAWKHYTPQHHSKIRQNVFSSLVEGHRLIPGRNACNWPQILVRSDSLDFLQLLLQLRRSRESFIQVTKHLVCVDMWCDVSDESRDERAPWTNLYNFDAKINCFGVGKCDQIWEKGALRAKRDFLSLFNLSPFQGSESPRLQTWFVSSFGLLLHRSNVRSLSKPPVLSSDLPKRGIKRRFSNAIDAGVRDLQWV